MSQRDKLGRPQDLLAEDSVQEWAGAPGAGPLPLQPEGTREPVQASDREGQDLTGALKAAETADAAGSI